MSSPLPCWICLTETAGLQPSRLLLRVYLDHSNEERNQFLAHVASRMKSYVPFSRAQGYEAIHDDATTSNGKQGLPRFSDVTQIEAQSGARAAFGISKTDLSAINEVTPSRDFWTSQAVPSLLKRPACAEQRQGWS